MKRSKTTRGRNGANKKDDDETETKAKDPFQFNAESSADDDFDIPEKRTTRHGSRHPRDRTSTPVPGTSRGRGQTKGKKPQRGGVDEEEIDRRLKDADMYEEQMTMKQKLEFIDVLNASLQKYDEHQEIEKALNESLKAETDNIPEDKPKSTRSRSQDPDPDILVVDFIESPLKSKSKTGHGGTTSRPDAKEEKKGQIGEKVGETENAQLKAKRPRGRTAKKAVVHEADILIESDEEVAQTAKVPKKEDKHKNSAKHLRVTSEEEIANEEEEMPKVGSNNGRATKKTNGRSKQSPEHNQQDIAKEIPEPEEVNVPKKRSLHRKAHKDKGKETAVAPKETGGKPSKKQSDGSGDDVVEEIDAHEPKKQNNFGNNGKSTRNGAKAKRVPDFGFTSESENDGSFAEEKAMQKKSNKHLNKAKSGDISFTSESENDRSIIVDNGNTRTTRAAQWNRGRPSKVGEDRDLNSSPDDETAPGEAQVDVLVHHVQKSFEEPILHEDDLFGSQQKVANIDDQKTLKNGSKPVHKDLDHGTLSSKQASKGKQPEPSKPMKLAVRDMLVDSDEDEEEETTVHNKPRTSGLNLNHSSDSEEGESIGSPVLGRESQIKRDTSLTIPDTQADWSLNAGDISRVPDTQQPAAGDDEETVDPGATGGTPGSPGWFDEEQEQSTVAETPTNKKADAESQPLFSPSPIPAESPVDRPGVLNIDRAGEKDGVAVKLDVVASSDLDETQDMSVEEEEARQDVAERKEEKKGSPVYKIQKSDENDVDVMELESPASTTDRPRAVEESCTVGGSRAMEEVHSPPPVSRSSTGSFEMIISREPVKPRQTRENAGSDTEDECFIPRNRKRRASDELSTELPPAKKSPAPSVEDVFNGQGEPPSPTFRAHDSLPPKALINKLRLKKKWHEKRPYFCPSDKDPNSYTGTIVAYFDQYRVHLRELQRRVLKKVEWGEAVQVGPHAKGTLDYEKPEPKYRLRGHEKPDTLDAQSYSTGSSAETQDYSYNPKTTEKLDDFDYHAERATKTRQQYRKLIAGYESDKDMARDKYDDDWKPEKVKGTGTSGKGMGTRLRRGRNLAHRRIGEKSAQQSITEHFGFKDMESTQAYNFDDNADDEFTEFESLKSKMKNSSHKKDQSATSASGAAHSSKGFVPVIDVDEDSHEALDLRSESGHRSRSVTPVGKSRSVTPDSQESKLSKSSASTSGVSRPVSSTSVVSNRSGPSTRGNTPFPYVDLGGGNTMADEETTNDTVYSEIDSRNMKAKSKRTNKDAKGSRSLKHVQEDHESDRISPVSDISEHSVKSKKTELQREFVESAFEPESQPMETIDSLSSGPHSEQDVFESSSGWLSSPKHSKVPLRTYGEKTCNVKKAALNKTYNVDSVSGLSDLDEEQRQELPLGKRLELDRIKKAKELSQKDSADPELEAVIKLSKEEFTKTAKDNLKEELSGEEELAAVLILSKEDVGKTAKGKPRAQLSKEDVSEDEEIAAVLSLSRKDMAKTAKGKPRAQLSEEEILVLKELDSDSDTKEDSEAEKVLKDETAADRINLEEDDEFVPKSRVRKKQQRGEIAETENKETRNMRLARKKNVPATEGKSEERRTQKNNTNKTVGECPCCAELFDDLEALQMHAAECNGPKEQPKPGSSKMRRGAKAKAFNQENVKDAIERGMKLDSGPPDFMDSDAVSSSDDYDPTKDKDKGSTEDDDDELDDVEHEEKESRHKGRGRGRGKGRGKKTPPGGDAWPTHRHSPVLGGMGRTKRQHSPVPGAVGRAKRQHSPVPGAVGRAKRQHSPVPGAVGRAKRHHSPDTPQRRKAPRVDLDMPIPQVTTPTDRRRNRAESRAQEAEDDPFDMVIDRRRKRAESRSQTQAQGTEDEQLDKVMGKKTPCFMCGKEFHEDVIQRHVNECLDSGAQQQEAEPRQTRNRQVDKDGAAKHADTDRLARGKKRTKQT